MSRPERSLSDEFGPSPTARPSMTAPVVPNEGDVPLDWLVRLRWVAGLGQLITVFVVEWVVGVELWTSWLLAIIAFTLVSNLGLTVLTWPRRAGAGPSEETPPAAEPDGPIEEASITRPRRRSALPTLPGADPRNATASPRRLEALLFFVLAIDLVSLTLMLLLTGGPQNPCAIFYFVNLALAAAILPPRRVWLLTALAIAGFASMYLWHVQIPALAIPHDTGRLLLGERITLAGAGYLCSFVGCACVVVFFITRVTVGLSRVREDLRRLESHRERARRLESLATLAAGAGHELASPLSTIALVTSELLKHLTASGADDTVVADVRLVREEVRRCREILDRMSGRVGQSVGEESDTMGVLALLERVRLGLPTAVRDRVSVESPQAATTWQVRVPVENLAQALRNLVQNGFDASPDEAAVQILVSRSEQMVRIVITDPGHGIDEETLARLGEPFFTTKEPGSGMGLGLFLTRTVLEQVGGSMTINSRVGHGTTVTVRLPLVESGVSPGAASSVSARRQGS